MMVKDKVYYFDFPLPQYDKTLWIAQVWNEIDIVSLDLQVLKSDITFD